MSIIIYLSIAACIIIWFFYKRALRLAYSSCRTLQGIAMRQVWSIKNYTDLAADGEAREYAQVQKLYLQDIDEESLSLRDYWVFCDLQEENRYRLNALKRSAEEIDMPDIPKSSSIREMNALIKQYEEIIKSLEIIERTRRLLTKSYHENNRQMLDFLFDLRKENSNR